MSSSRSASVTRLRFPKFGTRLLPNTNPKITRQESVVGHPYPGRGYGERASEVQGRSNNECGCPT